MTFLKTVTLLCAGLALAACTNPNRFGADDAAGLNGGMGAGMGAGMDGSASDPRSPAYFQQTVGDRVLFVIDTYNLTPEGQRTLDGQAQWLMTNRDYNAVIEGHADEQGTREYNLALGARRANSVEEYLIGKGVPAGRLRTVSYGKERPIEICSNEACYSQNRRAVTIISAGANS
ncbi:peptidoglycan-associated lipoprotein Pal [Roseovarius dicentrarchi]|uniref:peptidoglycan-associated lipoprotein Pal n=1 Tax=Roseovarius dicentrarchi TaxID=2250573 RepID=UPI000DEB072D|nr:peptidoglycan-associated lipoprotein Pal [Roseovarius dicentrarchi]